jgi:hypothetical protein
LNTPTASAPQEIGGLRKRTLETVLIRHRVVIAGGLPTPKTVTAFFVQVLVWRPVAD